MKWEEVGVAYSRNRTVAYDPVRLPGAAAYGYRFIAGGRVVSYCPLAQKGQRSEQPDLGRLGEAADVFIHPAA